VIYERAVRWGAMIDQDRLGLIQLIAFLSYFLACEAIFARGEWPDSPNKQWFQNLLRPDNHLSPSRRDQSLYCCGEADVVRTRFRVETADEGYPADRWFAWIDDGWIVIPPEKIVQGYAPDGQPYLFMWSGSIQCFVRPRGGL
jgi:hypothetical protein